jgi:Ca2+-binding EF-hand superfamily protein
MIAISALSSSIFSILLLSSRNNNDSSMLVVSASATGAPSSFIFLLKRRKQSRLVKTPTKEQQRTTVLLKHEGKQDGRMAVMEQRVNDNSNSKGRQIVLTTSSDSANGKSRSNINHGEQVTLHQGILDIPPSNGQVRPPPPQSLIELDLVEDEPYPDSIHPIDNAYDRLSQTLEEYDATTSSQNENTTTLLQDMSQSLDSMEGSEDDHVTYIRSISTIDESSSQRERLEKAEVNEEEITDLSSSSWAKRNARSIDEGVRFKFQLREGLEEQSKLHREQLLSDLLEGVIGGTSTALDAEPDVTIMKRNITNPIRLWWSERFGKKASNDESTTVASTVTDVEQKEDDAGLTMQTAASEESLDTTTQPDKSSGKSEFYSRTITGLLMALAEEAEGLEVSVDADESTPFWNKTFNSINIHFNRLGFRQLRFGGLDNVLNELEATLAPSEKFSFARGLFKAGGKPTTADEAFDKIDIDNSGSLDEDELAQALKMAAILGGNKFGARSKEMVADMASKLIRLYDTNGDGVVDREEYRVLVQDMTALRDARLREGLPQQTTASETDSKKQGWFRRRRREVSESSESIDNESDENIIDITDDENFWESLDHGEGSIVFKDMKLDLRRLLFGLIPGMKRILPGGPLILKPFTATVTASWTREDIMDSFLIDAGLRRLVSRALSRRVRGIRDLFDGAVFYGRTWKLFEQNAPLVEVQKLEDVQFDLRDRLIITGRAKIKAAPDAPSIENGFKLRTKIGTRGNGRIIGLLRPEIAIFAECPKKLEST